MLMQRIPTPIFGLHSEMEQLFNGILAPLNTWSTRGSRSQRMLPLKVWEDDESIRVEALVPGVQMDDLEIFVQGKELTMRGKRQPNFEQVKTWHRRERHEGEFTRVLELPVMVDANKVEASLKDGVLNISLTKAAESRPRKIEVKQLN